MKTPTLLLSLTLSLVTGGCIDTKDVGVESDASSGGATSEGSGMSDTASSTSATSDTATASGTATATESGTATAATQTGSETGVDTMGTMTSGATDTFGGSDTSSGSDTDGGEEEELCEASGGGWVLETCGHFVCGSPQDCQAVVPGCDCGEHRVFVDGLGCQVGAECEPYQFDCGEELCLAPNHFCDVSIPGVKGPTNYACVDMPAACDGNYSCACLDAEGLVAPGECDEEFKVGAITVTTAKP